MTDPTRPDLPDPGTDPTVTAGGDTPLAGAVVAADLPRALGRYQIEARLGAGGMGQVFRARDPQLNRTVAIKVLHTGDGSTGRSHELQQRLLREAQAMARLSHVNLAVVHDVGTVDGEVFIAMELIGGGTLKRWLATPRPWRARLAAIVAAGRGLAAAHAAGVIHRDFKPDNVLVADDGTIKVVDFGLARGIGEVGGAGRAAPASPDDVLATPLTVTGAVMGTPAYMAPEQQGGEAADARADQFSFAVAAFEAVHGRRPFAPTPTLALARGERPTAPATSEVPAAVTAALARALAAEPAARYPSMDALLEALVAAAAPRRRRWPWAVGGLIGIGGIAAWFALAGGGPVALPDAEIAAAIAAHPGDVGTCRSDALRTAPRFGGTVAVRVEIAPDGAVLSASAEGDPRGPAAACLAGAAMRWTFGAHDGPRTAVVRVAIAAAAAPIIHELGPGHYQIARSTIAQWRADPAPLMLGKWVPTQKDGKPWGTKIFAVPKGSDLEALGVRSADTVLSINGVPLDQLIMPSPAQAAALVDAPRYTIAAWRAGQPVTLIYDVVDAPGR